MKSEDKEDRRGYFTEEIMSNNPECAEQSVIREPMSNYAAVSRGTGLEPVMLDGGDHEGKRKYTIDDYYALPEERRVELIDGVIYDMTAPAKDHQMILGDLYILFRECADEHGMPCEVYLAPTDVRLDRDRYTMVQPDLLVICDIEGQDDERRIEGAPDLVVEILSPSTRSKDQVLKLYKYQHAGVREYWIVDPRYRKVTVHHFEKEEYIPRQYDFEEDIPVGISGGKCVIPFSRVMKRPFRVPDPGNKR